MGMSTYNDLPDHLSHSARGDAERCEKLFQLSRIIKAEEIPAWFFAGGTAVHQATEDHDRGVEVKPWDEYFYPLVESLLEREPQYGTWLHGGSDDSPDMGDEWNEIGPRCIENWQAFTTGGGFEVTDVEVDVTTILPGCYIPIKGFIDRIGVHPVHGEMIVDIKTGKNRPKGKKQLETYAALLRQKTGRKVTKGAFFMAREGRLTRPVDLSLATPGVVGKQFGDTVSALSYRTFKADKQFNCKWCVHKLNCFAFSGDTPRTRYYDPANPGYDHNQGEEPPF